MIDSFFRSPYQKRVIDPLLKWNPLKGVSPSLVTSLGLGVGLFVPLFLAWGFSLLALGALLFSGFLDTLDGSLARTQNLTSNKGAVLDIVSDRIVESGVILGLFLYDPARGLLCILMLIGVTICVTSFLIVSLFSENHSEKSFHYSPGLIERAEAFIFFSLLIVFPALFIPLATLFTVLMFITTFQRVYQFYNN